MLFLSILCTIFILIILILWIKIHFLRKSVDEISSELYDKRSMDTNTLISVTSRDPHIRRLAAELNDQLRLLKQERRQLQSGGMELKEAVTNISHDLRTPLTAVCGYLSLLKKEEKSETVSRYLAVIEKRSEDLKQLIEEFFLFSVVTSKPTEEDYEEIVLNRILEESITANYALLKGCGIVPKISIPERKICRKLNRKLLIRIFENVISNAVKYSDGDLEICLTEDGKVIISNHAKELDEVQVGKFFNRFYTVKDAKVSTGIGLSIARKLTEQMNGTITADYQNGKVSVCIIFEKTMFVSSKNTVSDQFHKYKS